MAGESSDQQLLQRIVIENSEAGDWIEAKKEWKLVSIYDKPYQCICKHKILENCIIRNKNNNNELIVGNVCVNHFKEDDLLVPKSSRTSLKRLYGNPKNAKSNKALIDVAIRLKILTINEGKKYSNLKTGARSDRYQQNVDFKQKINKLIMLGFTANRPMRMRRIGETASKQYE